MIEREQREERQLRSVPVEVICDRCGENALIGIGFVNSDYPFDGSYLRGRFFPPSGNASLMERVEAELCAACTKDLLEWIGGGAYVGTGHRDP